MYKTAALFSILCLLLLGSVGCNLLPLNEGEATPSAAVPPTAASPQLEPSDTTSKGDKPSTDGEVRATAAPLPRPTSTPLPARAWPAWELYTNGNTVREMVWWDGQLYAATGGGVVQWDLATAAPTKYTTQAGLPSHDVTSITVCDVPDTRIVAGTAAGLALYDPSADQWETWQTANTDMASDDVLTVACLGSPGGQVLAVGYDMGGLNLYDPRTNSWGLFDQDMGLASNLVRHIALTPNAGQGTTAFVVSSGFNISLINAGGLRTFDSDNGLPNDVILDVATTADGRIWLATLAGLIWGDGGDEWTLIPTAAIGDLPAGLLNALSPVGNQLWLVTSFGRLCLFDPATSRCTRTHTAEAGMMERGTAVLFANDTLFYASEEGEGIRALVDNSWQALALDEVLPSNQVKAVGQDGAGDVWLATTRGLIRTADQAADWQLLNRASGDEGDLWTALYASPTQAGVWLGSYEGLSFFDGDQTWQRWSQEDGLLDDTVRSITAAPNGNIWVGTSTGLSQWDGVSFTNYPLETTVLSLVATAAEVWIGSQGNGLWRLDLATQEVERVALDGEWVLALAQAADGRLLVGDTSDLYEFDPVTGELAAVPGLTGIFINSIQALPTGEILVAIGTGEAFYYNGQTWQSIWSPPLLPRLNQLFQDQNGTFWFAGDSFNPNGGGLVRGRE